MNAEGYEGESIIKPVGHIAQAITDMSMEDYARWIVYGVIPESLKESERKEHEKKSKA